MSTIFDLWVLATLAAATFQTIRFMLQKHLATATLSPAGATFSRFVYSAPFIVLLLVFYLIATGQSLSWPPGPTFWLYGLCGGTAQILATVCVVSLFKQRNFAVGITFKKTEVIQTALVGWLVLGEGVGQLGLLAILIGVAGVLLLSDGKGQGGQTNWRNYANKAAGLGITSGLLFAISGVCYRGASLQIDAADPFLRAALTLAAVVLMQTTIMAVWLRVRDPGQISAVWSARRVAIWVGLTSMGGSFCWFVAFAVQNAAYVKALGQIELILSIAASTLMFKERISPREWLGMAVLMASILVLGLAV